MVRVRLAGQGPFPPTSPEAQRHAVGWCRHEAGHPRGPSSAEVGRRVGGWTGSCRPANRYSSWRAAYESGLLK